MAIREVKVRIQIEEPDYQHKLESIIRFLDRGDQVRLTAMLRGRELGHEHVADNLLSRFVKDLENHGKTEWPPVRQERQVSLIFESKR